MKQPQFVCEHVEPRRLLSASDKLFSLPESGTGNVVENDSFWFVNVTNSSSTERLISVRKSDGVTSELYTGTISFDFGISGVELINGKLFFFTHGGNGGAFYESDGTLAGTKSVKYLPSQTNSGAGTSWRIGNKLYFTWNVALHSDVLYESDGTAAGTNIIWQVPNLNTSSPQLVARSDVGTLYFAFHDQLWIANAENPVPRHLLSGFDISNCTVTEVVATPSRLYFTSNALRPNQGEYSQRLFTSRLDGSELQELSIPNAANYTYPPSIGSLVLVGEQLLFRSVGKLWSMEGTGPASSLMGGVNGSSYSEWSDLYKLRNGKVAFYYGMSGTHLPADGIYVTDGTLAGTVQLIQEDLSDYRFITRYEVGNFSYFMTDPTVDIGAGWNVIQSDGTVQGTRRIRYLVNEGSEVSFVGATGNRPLVLGVPADRNGGALWSLNPLAGTGSFEGGVFTDWTRDWIFQSFEPHVYGTIFLDNDQSGRFEGGWETAQLNEDGYYKFSDLAEGTYTVAFKPTYTTSPAVHTPSGLNWQVTIGPGAQLTNINFVADPTFTLVWGSVFNDLDSNGTQDAGESPASAQVLYLDLNADGVFSSNEPQATTDSNGYFTFQSVAAGNVAVGRRDKLNWIQTVPALRGTRSETLASNGAVFIGVFGVHAQASGSVSGTMWNDNNANGVIDGPDTVLNGGLVYADLNRDGVRQANEPTAGATNGKYTFASTPSESTVFRFWLSSAYPPGSSVSPTNGFDVAVPIGAADTTSRFLVSRPGQILPNGVLEGVIFDDQNRNGIHEATEATLSGVLVYLDANENERLDEFERRDITSAFGTYSFPNSAMGPYRVRVDMPPGYDYSLTQVPASVWMWDVGPFPVVNVGLRTPDQKAPQATDFQYVAATHEAVIEFDEPIVGTVGVNDIVLRDSAGAVITATPISIGLDASGCRATITFDVLDPRLSIGLLELDFHPLTLTDRAGNSLVPSTHEFSARTGDLDGDGVVSFSDMLIVVQHYGLVVSRYSSGNVDYSSDGKVDFDDLLIIAQAYARDTRLAAAPTSTKRRSRPVDDSFNSSLS